MRCEATILRRTITIIVILQYRHSSDQDRLTVTPARKSVQLRHWMRHIRATHGQQSGGTGGGGEGAGVSGE